VWAKKREPAVQRESKVELFLNLRTATARGGITVPLPLSSRTDEVIE
jgi:hypothetical protein